ncbi:MAG TPA: Gfo/Idh/MocA family oxidoreductase [Candidatus Brocadiia bacterium]|nr:Gfo/Idh/MocA family oxidoreductase [Candidatus Brocadiia bacterium]
MSRRLRWGVVGCGDITNKRVAPAIRENPRCELAAFCSGSKARAEEFAERHGAGLAFDNMERFLGAGLDCVYVASRVFEHAGQAVAALGAGAHVLCEKPMAMNGEECGRMNAAAARANRRLGVAYYRRFYPAWVAAREVALSGRIGDIVGVRIWLGSFWDMRPSNPKYWRVQRAYSGGGPLADVGTHRLDLLVDLLGQPVELAAFASCRHHDWDVEDTCAILMRMACGAYATAHVCGDTRPPRDEFEIVGVKGWIHLPQLGDRLVVTGAESREEWTMPLAANVHAPLVEDFVSAVVDGTPLRCSGEEGAKTTRILDAAYRSAENGAMVRL